MLSTPLGKMAAVLDVSGWQMAYIKNGLIKDGAKNPALAIAKGRGIKGVFARVGNGKSYDYSFHRFGKSAETAGLPFGAYYYCQPGRYGPAETTEIVVKQLEQGQELANKFPTQLPLMLDLEHYWDPQLSVKELTFWIKQVQENLWGRLGHKPIIYTAGWWWNSRVTGDWESTDFMLARYSRGNTPPPSQLSSWNTWIPWDRGPHAINGKTGWEGWQFSSSANGHDFGMPHDAATSRLDVNVVHEAAFNRWVNVGPKPPTDPIKEVKYAPPQHWGLFPLDPKKPKLNVVGYSPAHTHYLQSVLYHYAGGNIVVDGIYGTQTEGRVEDFQRFFGLTVDGWVGPQTWGVVDYLVAIRNL